MSTGKYSVVSEFFGGLRVSKMVIVYSGENIPIEKIINNETVLTFIEEVENKILERGLLTDFVEGNLQLSDILSKATQSMILNWPNQNRLAGGQPVTVTDH